eukprot:978698-Heterocapsa_arctica.AAC.1
MGLLGILPSMKFVEQMQGKVDYRMLSVEGQQKATLLYNLLVQLVQGRALAIVRGVTDAKGLEVWRLLVAEYEPKQAARWVQMLQGILKPVWSSSLSFEIDVRAWELSLKRYEEAANVLIPDNIKCTVMAQHAPRAIKTFLRMVPYDVLNNYGVLRASILDYLT